MVRAPYPPVGEDGNGFHGAGVAVDNVKNFVLFSDGRGADEIASGAEDAGSVQLRGGGFEDFRSLVDLGHGLDGWKVDKVDLQSVLFKVGDDEAVASVRQLNVELDKGGVDGFKFSFGKGVKFVFVHKVG
jgi:hypothetical protein